MYNNKNTCWSGNASKHGEKEHHEECIATKVKYQASQFGLFSMDLDDTDRCSVTGPSRMCAGLGARGRGVKRRRSLVFLQA